MNICVDPSHTEGFHFYFFIIILLATLRMSRFRRPEMIGNGRF